jgi:hypothetical protein
MMLIIRFSVILCLLSLISCNRGIDSEGELYNYLGKEKNGLISSRTHDGIKFTMKYLPSEYLAFNELKTQYSPSRIIVDSTIKSFNDTYSFLLTVEFDGVNAGENPLMFGINNLEEYKEKIEELSFDLDQSVYIQSDSADIAPVLWNLENSYTAGNKRSLLLVFPKTGTEKSKSLDIVFSDNIFSTGINHFNFRKESIQSIPRIDCYKLLKI